MVTPTTSTTPPPRISEEIRKMKAEPLDAVEQKLIWYTFFTGIGLLFLLVWISSLVR